MSVVAGMGIAELALERQYIPKDERNESLCPRLQVILVGKRTGRLLSGVVGNVRSPFVKGRVVLPNTTVIEAIIYEFILFGPTFLLSD